MYREQIREILGAHGRLQTPIQTLTDEADLYEAGLTSLVTVNLLLALEDAFDVEFPDHLLNRTTFQSIATLSEALEEIVGV